MSLSPVFSVSECVEAVNQHLSLLGEIVIEGEISRIDVKNGRLVFTTITDPHSALDVFGLTHQIRNIRQLEPGMLVHVYGTAGLYKGSGRFRIFADQIVPHGEGALQIALEKLKSQLEAEGLFDLSHKRLLPPWPLNIGLITAAQSSAYHDVIKVLSARMGGLTIKHLPVTVQGRDAVPTLLKAFHYINTHPKELDVVILTRGGGSLEDLAAFNSEEIARAVFACKVPIVSAVGHEDDWSLTDFTADLRASTPSNAAELVVKDRHEVAQSLDLRFDRLSRLLHQQVKEHNYQVIRSLHTIKLEINRLSRQILSTITRYQQLLAQSRHQTTYLRNSIDQLGLTSKSTLSYHLKSTRQQVIQLERLLRSLDHQNILKRGFSISRLNGRIVKDAHQAKPGETLTTLLYKGQLQSKIIQGD
jgi:exodeoxyribonuclease VII large subunit